MEHTANLQLPYLMPMQAQKSVTHNEALRLLDMVIQIAILDRDLSTPPSTPAEGDRYIVAAGATDAWTGQQNAVAAWTDGAWSFAAPRPGWLAFIVDEGQVAYWSGSAWESLEATLAVLQNLTLLGVGTTSDATSPFSAKLNSALWTAKYAAEAGTGDLRQTLNKEAAPNVLSLLLQTNWSGRAELGLIGDDDLTLKVSADGTSWTEALRVKNDGSNALVSVPATIQVDGGIALNIDLQDGNGVFQATRYAAGASAPVFFGRKARGTRTTPAAVQAGDSLLGFRGYGHDGSGFASGTNGAAFLLEAAENWLHGTNYGTQIRLFTTTSGTTTNVERLRVADSGDLQMGGANTVVNASRHPVLRSYTVTTLPSATQAGQMIYVANGTSNKRLAVADGLQWRFPDGAIVS